MFAYRILSCLPLGLLYLLAWPGYLLLYYLAGYRKAVVRQNLQQAFPDESEKALTVLAKKFYRQLVQVAPFRWDFVGGGLLGGRPRENWI